MLLQQKLYIVYLPEHNFDTGNQNVENKENLLFHIPETWTIENVYSQVRVGNFQFSLEPWRHYSGELLQVNGTISRDIWGWNFKFHFRAAILNL